MFNIIKSMYSNVKSQVRQGNKMSEPFECRLGVRQGECLSPFLFAMYVNDLESHLVNHSTCGADIGLLKLYLLFYADDAVIFSETRESLQSGLNSLSQYCKKWKMVLNTDKTKIVIFRKGGRLAQADKWYYEGAEIEVVKSFKYLGLLFTAGGSFAETQKTLAGQAMKAVFRVKQFMSKFTNMPPRLWLHLFDVFVAPILNYAAELWGFHTAQDIERVHTKYCKNILHIRWNSMNALVYGELGRTDMRVVRLGLIINYWLKILQMPGTRYVKKVYCKLKEQSDATNVINWASLVKDLICNLGFAQAWYEQSVGDVGSFKNLVKQRLHDQFVQHWDSLIRDSSRGCFFSAISSSLEYSNYLDVVKVPKYRVALSRLRLCSHTLASETGRWHEPPLPYADRYCPFCGIYEDEYHMVMVCPAYEDLRKQLLPKYYWKRPSMVKCVELFKKESIIVKLAKYVYMAFSIRTEAMRE